jgi:hypothetical protein
MTIAQCLLRPYGARRLHVVVALVVLILIVLACAGMSPDWVAAAAATIALALHPSTDVQQRGEGSSPRSG